MQDKLELLGKRIIVTGGARGLGQSFASALVKNGANVVIADILEDVGFNSASQIGAAFVPLDLSEPVSITNCVASAVSELGGLDGLVNCGAIATGIGGIAMDEIEIAIWDKVLSVNVRGTWLMSNAAIPHLEKNDNSKIINLASDTALWGAPKLMHYVASKGAIISMTRSMSRELGEKGIAVNCIAPGLTKVEATEYVPEERKQLYIQGRSIQREQLPSDIDGTAIFLLSDASNFMTGQCIAVNGGFVMS